MRVNFVVATRLNEEVFWRDSLAGQFFRIFDVGSGEVKLFPKNTIGLSKIYDSALDDYRHSGEVTVFMHDEPPRVLRRLVGFNHAAFKHSC